MIEDRLVQALYVADGRGHGDMQDVVAEERARRKPRRPVARAVPSALATRTPREVSDVAKGRGEIAPLVSTWTSVTLDFLLTSAS